MVDDDDLWFLPAEPTEDLDIPGLAGSAAPMDSGEWVRAEERTLNLLAQVVYLQGRFDQLQEQLGQGFKNRIGLICASQLIWWADRYISPDQLVLWENMYLTPIADEIPAYQLAATAYRRILSGSTQSAANFSARVEAALNPSDAHSQSPIFEKDQLAQANMLHNVNQAAYFFKNWRIGTDPGAGSDITAGVGALILGAVADNCFLPLGLSGPDGLRANGNPERFLNTWLAALISDLKTALALGVAQKNWHAVAIEKISADNGKAALRLLECVTRNAYVTVASAQKELGISRATAQRHLEMLQRNSILKEITGQDRYRVWTMAC